MGMKVRLLTVVVMAAVLAPASASAATLEAQANGNPFTGGLSFTPAELEVAVGDSVRWTNTDSFVPHTVTEDHELFNLSGTYGIPGSMGFGPGETVEWRFAAGSFSYFCVVHPSMVGKVDAPVGLKVIKKKGKKRKVAATWAKEALPEGQVFDVERSVDGGAFKSLLDETRELDGKFKAKKGTEVTFQARVHLEGDEEASSGYSPAATIKVK